MQEQPGASESLPVIVSDQQGLGGGDGVLKCQANVYNQI